MPFIPCLSQKDNFFWQKDENQYIKIYESNFHFTSRAYSSSDFGRCLSITWRKRFPTLPSNGGFLFSFFSFMSWITTPIPGNSLELFRSFIQRGWNPYDFGIAVSGKTAAIISEVLEPTLDQKERGIRPRAVLKTAYSQGTSDLRDIVLVGEIARRVSITLDVLGVERS
jgi:hypothetical protein